MLQDLVGAVFEDIVGLFLIHIQTHAGELVHTDSLDQVIGLYQGAPGGVHKDNAVFHLFDGFNVDQVVGGVHQGAVKRYDITVGK